MINASNEYAEAIVAAARKTSVLIPLKVADPHTEYSIVDVPDEAPFSKFEQLVNDDISAKNHFVTLEPNIWRLDGNGLIIPDDNDIPAEIGFVSDDVCDQDGYFTSPLIFSFSLSGITMLRNITIAFHQHQDAGVAEELNVKVKALGSIIAERDILDNADKVLFISGLAAYAPDELEISIIKWSIPYRRARISEIYPGYRIDLENDDISSMVITMQASMSGTSMPYGTANIEVDNTSRVFDPRNAEGLFQSLVERMPIPIKIGVETENGIEYIPCGTYYWQQKSWSMTDAYMTMAWNVVDIIGMMSSTMYQIPDVVPTTLRGWIESAMESFEDGFSSMCIIDPDYADLQINIHDIRVLENVYITDVIRWVCQMANVFARADAVTGKLAIEPVWSQGVELKLDNLQSYPELQANDNISSMVFYINDERITINGNTNEIALTQTNDNPFVRTNEQAVLLAQNIMNSYGGRRIRTTGRGDPTSEIGDAVTVEMDSSTAYSGRIVYQTLSFENRVLSGCVTEVLQADGYKAHTDVEILTENCTWTPPVGVTSFDVILVGGGQAGGHGKDGTYSNTLFHQHNVWEYGTKGDPGINGTGGKVWFGTINMVDPQSFVVTIGHGGHAGAGDPVDGTPTNFGNFSSENGHVYSPSFVDINTGKALARTGVKIPTRNNGDGGIGGKGGSAGGRRMELWTIYLKDGPIYRWRIMEDVPPGLGQAGVNGSDGCVIIYYDKE